MKRGKERLLFKRQLRIGWLIDIIVDKLAEKSLGNKICEKSSCFIMF